MSKPLPGGRPQRVRQAELLLKLAGYSRLTSGMDKNVLLTKLEDLSFLQLLSEFDDTFPEFSNSVQIGTSSHRFNIIAASRTLISPPGRRDS